MDAPVMDVDVVAQQLFSNVNIGTAYHDTISPELSGDNGILRITKEGKVVQFELPKELQVTRGKTGQVLKEKENTFKDYVVQNRLLDIIRSVSNNIEDYDGLMQGLDWKMSDEGRESQLKEYRAQYNQSAVAPKHLEAMKRIMTRLQDTIAKTDASILIKPYEYFVSRDDSLNAFSTFNRTIVANTGLFEKMTEDEMAAVLAHELSHGQNQHTEEGVRKRAGIVLGMGMLGMKNDAGLVNVLMRNIERQGVSMGHERLADAQAFQYLVDSGYNPGALAALYQKYHDEGFTGSLGDNVLVNASNPIDHPLSLARRDNAIKRLVDYSNGHVSLDNETILVDGQPLCKMGKEGNSSALERACLAVGNLAKAYHDGKPGMSAYVKDNKIFFGKQEIMTCGKNDESTEKIVSRLNDIHSQGLSALLSQEGTSLFKTGQSVPKDNLVNGGENLASIGNTKVMNSFSHMKQYDRKGQEISSKTILDGEKQQEVIVGFSNKAWETFEKIRKINIYEPDKEKAGRQAGQILGEMLQDKNSVEFFRMMQQNADYVSEKMEAGFSQFLPKAEKNLTGKGSKSEADYLVHKQYFEILTGMLGVNSPDKDFKDNPLIRMGDNYTWSPFGTMENLAVRDGFEAIAQNPEFRKGMQEEFQKNTQAMRNFEEIHSMQNDIMGNVEGLRTNGFDASVKTNSISVKKMEQGMDLMRKFMDKNKVKEVYEGKDEVNKSIKNIMEAYMKNISLLNKELQKNKVVLDNLIKTYPSAENLNQKKEIDKNLERVNNLRNELLANQEWGPVAKKVMDKIEKRPSSLTVKLSKSNVAENSAVMPKFSMGRNEKKNGSLKGVRGVEQDNLKFER